VKIGIEHKNIATILLLMGIATQWFHKLFEGKEHSVYTSVDNGEIVKVFWSDMIYYFFSKTSIFLLVVIVCCAFWSNNASRTLMSGVFGWYLFEWVEITLKMLKIIVNYLFVFLQKVR
jgi:hypothetical protein